MLNVEENFKVDKSFIFWIWNVWSRLEKCDQKNVNNYWTQNNSRLYTLLQISIFYIFARAAFEERQEGKLSHRERGFYIWHAMHAMYARSAYPRYLSWDIYYARRKCSNSRKSVIVHELWRLSSWWWSQRTQMMSGPYMQRCYKHLWRVILTSVFSCIIVLTA